MIKYVYILLLMPILFSCASQKKEERRLDIDSRLKSLEEFNNSSLSKASELDWIITRESEELDVYIKRYDTQAQPDSLGNYPLKEEETRTSKGKKQKEETKQKEENIETSDKSTIEIDHTKKIVGTEITKATTDVGSPFNLNWLWFLIISALAYYLIKKFVLKK